MEKRLLDVYDHTTMPDACARRIETRLAAELQERQKSRYTKMIAPGASSRGSWAAAAACLLLVLMAGGTLLWYWMTSPAVNIPESFTAEEPTATEVQPEREYYEGFTDFVLKVLPDGSYAFVRYAGKKESIEIPTGRGQNLVTEIGTGEPVIQNGDKVKVVIVPKTVRIIRKNAFANCPALEAVYFKGDAPDGAESVFEGTENVVVYYQHGKKGWEDTWCGRKTLEYGEGHISLGTVTLRNRVPALFRDILSGVAAPIYGNLGDITVEEYCTALWGDAVEANAFTLVDMDADGVCELVFAPKDAEGMTLGYLVFRVAGTKICGYTLRGRDLRKDGTFYSYDLKGDSRIYIQDEASYVSIQSADFMQQDKPLAQWHTYPCEGFELVLESYRYASETGASTSPGYGYYYFESLAYGEMANDWSQIQYWMSREGVCIEDGNMVYAYDPDAPGCVFYGTLTGEGQQRKFSSMGYYICDEAGEYRAEVFDLDQPNPAFTVDPPTDDRGREVASAKEMMEYLGHTPYYDTVNRDVQQIAELLDSFVYRYVTHDTAGMQEYMAEDAWELSSYPFAGEISIVSYGTLPDSAVPVGESWHTSVELLEYGESKSGYHLAVVLTKQTDGWKIHSYSIEKQ